MAIPAKTLVSVNVFAVELWPKRVIKTLFSSFTEIFVGDNDNGVVLVSIIPIFVRLNRLDPIEVPTVKDIFIEAIS